MLITPLHPLSAISAASMECHSTAMLMTLNSTLKLTKALKAKELKQKD